ncbi:MAG: MASE1 domain-containing protein, partial [Gemmatimonadota bacterium]
MAITARGSGRRGANLTKDGMQTSRRRERGWSSDLAKMALLAIAYFAAGRLSLHLSLVEENITPLWPPTGIALVAFLLHGRRLWPAVAIGAFALNLPISANIWAAAATATGNTLAPLIAASLLQRTGFDPGLERLR